ncbi:MAG: hypothetical protein K0R39_1125 [Symbiobacteriaceae bacterium]|jgi:hypothetical protein|nr:hypothetical protein [Symbiobacteriaceae bacterium]
MPVTEWNPRGYVIRLSEPALIYLCQTGLEAYSVAHQRKGPRRELETYGLLWGHATPLTDGRTLYAIDMATVDTSAAMDHDSVIPSLQALELKRDIMTSYWPHLTFLGDFHTHPYRRVDEVLAGNLYAFSEDDRDSIEGQSELWSHHGYRVGLVLTIACLERASSRQDRWLIDSVIEFTLGNYRLWLKAYVAYQGEHGLRLTADDDQQVLLDCPSLLGLQGEYTAFGRGKPGKGHQSPI